MDDVLSTNPSANVFAFGDFNVHHKYWLIYSNRTDRSGEFCHNFSISNDLTQMVNVPTSISDYDSHNPMRFFTVFWISYFLVTLVFVLRWFSLHWEILIKLLSQFPLTFQ